MRRHFVAIILTVGQLTLQQDAYASPSTSASPSTAVYVFGGFGTTEQQMHCWQQSALQQPGALSKFEFAVFAYPSRFSDSKRALKDSAKLIAKVVENIERQLTKKSHERIVLVGHSSGAALANRVASLLPASEQVELVVLDGYVPEQALQKKFKTTCWWASNPEKKIESRNARFIKASCAVNARGFVDKHCLNAWCLHVSLFELNIPKKLNPRQLATLGLKNCSANLVWLE